MAKTKRYRAEDVSELPEHGERAVVYLVGEQNKWALQLKCPCGCGADIILNLLRDADPCWRYTMNGGEVSISPSIRRVVGCKSHFFISKGRVEWAHYRGRKRKWFSWW